MAMAEAGYPKTIRHPNFGSEFATFDPPAASLAELQVHLRAYRLVGLNDLTDEEFFGWVVDDMDEHPRIYVDEYRRDTKAHLAALRGELPQICPEEGQ